MRKITVIECRRFHPSCMGMTIEEAKKLEYFLCTDCSAEDDAKRSINQFPVSPTTETKVKMCLPFSLALVSMCACVVHAAMHHNKHKSCGNLHLL